MIETGIKLTETRGDFNLINIKKPNEYVHRVLGGGVAVETVYYPYRFENEDTGEEEVKWKVLKRSPTDGSKVLDALHSADSQFRPDRKWLFLVIDKSDATPEIKVAQYPYTVAAKIVELENKRKIGEEKMLRYGPSFAWDCIINHKYDETKKGPSMSKHSYTVEVGSHEFDGVFPKEFLNTTKHPNPLMELPQEVIDQMFSEEEWAAIQDSTVNLGDFAKPNSDEEINRILMDKPVYVNATRLNPVTSRKEPILNDHKAVAEILNKYGLKAITAGAKSKELPEKSSEGKTGLDLSAIKKEEPEEAQFTVVEDKKEEEDEGILAFAEKDKKESDDAMSIIQKAFSAKKEAKTKIKLKE
jgi:hypothetical protein